MASARKRQSSRAKRIDYRKLARVENDSDDKISEFDDEEECFYTWKSDEAQVTTQNTIKTEKDGEDSRSSTSENSYNSDSYIEKISSSLIKIIEQIDSDEIDHQLRAIRRLKHLIFKEGAVLSNVIFEYDLVTKLFSFLKNDNPDVVLQAMETLRFIATGTNIAIGSMIDLERFNIISTLISSEKFDVIEQIIWFIGGIIVYNSYAKYVENLVGQILSIRDNPSQGLSFVRALVWTLSGVMTKNKKNTKVISGIIVNLLQFPDYIPRVSTLINVFLTSKQFTLDQLDHSCHHLYKTIGILSNFLSSDDNDIVTLTLRAVSLTLAGSSKPSKILTESKLLSTFYGFFYDGQTLLNQEAAFCIEVIAFRSIESTVKIINTELLHVIIERLRNSKNQDLQLRLIHLVFALMDRIPDQFTIFLNCNILNSICDYLESVNDFSRIVTTILVFLTTAEKSGSLDKTKSIIIQNGGLDKLKQLQNDINPQISDVANYVMKKYFSFKDVNEEIPRLTINFMVGGINISLQ